jgi:hypothetical protein
MAIPSDAYLKLKIPGPAGVITVEANTQQVLDYEQDDIELATTAVDVIELRELSLRIPTALLSSAMPLMSGVFKMDEDTKAVQINAGNPTKIM